ncbi:MAG: sialidase family protein [Acidobacteriota bacterium]|nr:sialidase family protein [Acidobacteriota bacterium]
MPFSKSTGFACVTLAAMLAIGCAGPPPEVRVLRAPEGASLPQAVLDDSGTLHLIYYTGSMSNGDLWHVTRSAAADAWSEPKRVNSDPNSVAGLGPMDGGQLAIGPDGLLHTTWFHRDPGSFYYARTDHTGKFGPQQNLSAKEEGGIEAGSTVTVDDEGNVYVFWHADPVEDAKRRVYMAVSRDNGKLFDLARPVGPETEGACGCCGLRAVAAGEDTVHVSYRGAGDNVRRGMRLLTSPDMGRTFTDQLLQPWDIGACPVSTTTFGVGPQGTLVAWETHGQVYFADTERLDEPVSPPGEAAFRRKNPTLAINPDGDTLLAWGDGPGFNSGGTLHWQLFDDRGRPVGEERGEPSPIPARSVPTIVTPEDGSFLVVY